MKQSKRFQYPVVKSWLDSKFLSSPELFEELKAKCEHYSRVTRKRCCAYEIIIRIYNIGEKGTRCSGKTVAKILGITEDQADSEKHLGLFLLGYDAADYAATKRMAAEINFYWWRHLRLERAKKKIEAAKEIGELPQAQAEVDWGTKMVANAQQHLNWLEAERRKLVSIIVHIKEDYGELRVELERLEKLRELEREGIRRIEELRRRKNWF